MEASFRFGMGILVSVKGFLGIRWRVGVMKNDGIGVY